MSDSIHANAGGEQSLTTDQILQAEREEIWGRGGPEGDPAALCLSGGGIRSASFALGVMQALAAKGLLTRFHYLSTVSGGGYIGGWLTRWIQDEADRNGNDMLKAAASVQTQLRQSAEGKDGSADPLRRLREYTNYLTPQVGLASTDTWTGIVLYVRNLLLNWLVFLPTLMLVALIPNLLVRGMDAHAHAGGAGGALSLAVGALALFASVYMAGRYLPSHSIGDPNATGLAARNADLEHKGRIHPWIAGTAVLWAALLTVYVSSVTGAGQTEARAAVARWAGAAAFGASVLAYVVAAARAAGNDRGFFLRQSPFWIVAACVPAALLVSGAHLLWRFIPEDWQLDVLTTVGPLWIVTAHLLQSAAYTGLRTARWGDDDDREWLARLSAVTLSPMVGWALLAVACLLLPRLLWDGMGIVGWISAALAGGSGGLAALGGSSGRSAVEAVAKRAGKAAGGTFNLVIAVATPIAAAGLFALMGRIDVTLAQRFVTGGAANPDWPYLLWMPLLVMVPVLAAAVLFLSWRINVNRFSLHGLYRNRLARAFLGSANAGRRPHPFTNFDPTDNPALFELGAGNTAEVEKGAPRRVLFPVINVALNVTRSARLAWQERKAMSFSFSPLACGSAQLFPDAQGLSAAERQDPCNKPDGAYVRSTMYGNSAAARRSGRNSGVSLATAVTISGAAASPNMGYHSSPATAFLMTLFNVRLGAWLANPARRIPGEWRRSGPLFSILPLMAELLGQTDERGRYVYLSDGGHFENLAVYEMLRRRCRRIVVSDAGCDAGCTFEDLGNLVRKAFIDQDVTISFKTMQVAARRPQDKDVPEGTVAYAYGTITYPKSADGTSLTGEIVYIKPSYFTKPEHFADMPLDVRAYAEAHETFPHESTADQWFTESQFESYRRLGYFLMSKALAEPEYQGFFDGLREREPVVAE